MRNIFYRTLYVFWLTLLLAGTGYIYIVSAAPLNDATIPQVSMQIEYDTLVSTMQSKTPVEILTGVYTLEAKTELDVLSANIQKIQEIKTQGGFEDAALSETEKQLLNMLSKLVLPTQSVQLPTVLESAGLSFLCETLEDTRTVECLTQDERVIVIKNDATWQKLLIDIELSVKADAKAGLFALKDTIPTRDYIFLDIWGDFLDGYCGKQISEFRSGNVVFKFENYLFEIKPTNAIKQWLFDELVPTIIGYIEQESLNYPVERHSLRIKGGMTLQEFTLNMDNTELVSVVYPLTGYTQDAKDPLSYYTYNMGTGVGLVLNTDYVKILKGYHGESKYDSRVDSSSAPACVNVLAPVVLVKNLSGLTLNDKYLKDMMGYNDLAVNLKDNTLTNMSDMTTEHQDLRFSEFSLNPESLLLVVLNDSVVVVQPTYLECFNYAGKSLNTTFTLDLTAFLSTGEDIVHLKSSLGTTSSKLSSYINEDGFIDVQLGNAPFLIYCNAKKLPYDRIIMWLYSPYGENSLKTSDAQKQFSDMIKNDMSKQGLDAEYKAYMQATGQSNNMLLIGGSIFLILVIVGVIIFVVIHSKAKRNANIQDSQVLFEDDSNDLFNSEDDNDGPF